MKKIEVKVLDVNSEGAEFLIDGKKVGINFAECAENFKKTGGGSGKSVGWRDVTKTSFLFYSEPRVSVRFFGLFAKIKFDSLEKKIRAAGYRTRDIS